MKNEEKRYEKTLGKRVLPKGQAFECGVCGSKGRHYYEVQMSDSTVERVGSKCLKKLTAGIRDSDELGRIEQQGKDEEIEQDTKRWVLRLKAGEECKITIWIHSERRAGLKDNISLELLPSD